MTIRTLFGVNGNSANGPTTATSFSGNFISGMVFCVTGEAWLEGYWWWLCPSGGQATGATKCALWQIDPGTVAHLVAGSVTTSGALTSGWNYIPLSAPILLSVGGSAGMTPSIPGLGTAEYIAAIGCNGPFPDTNNYWGSGQPGAAGIINGPLTAYSGVGGSLLYPYHVGANGSSAQGLFTTAGSDPSVNVPNTGSNTDNFWVDVQVSDYSGVSASGPSLRLWPSFPTPAVAPNLDTGLAVTGTAFTLSQSCKLDKIWMFSPSGATGLASRVGIWNTGTQTEVSGTDNSSPAWKDPGGASASAGDGWIYVDYSSAGVTLPAGNYCTSFFNGTGTKIYYDSANYWFAGTDPVGGGTVGGPGHAGLSVGGGILTAPNVAGGPSLIADATGTPVNGNCQYTGPTSHVATTTWVYPSNFEATGDWGESRWADVEVTPAASGSGLLMASAVL